MTVRYAYIAVEGPHDLEFVGTILRPHGFRRVLHKSKVDPFWGKLIPKDFPFDGDDLAARAPVPVFFRAADRWVAVKASGGDTQLAANTVVSLAPLNPIDAVAVVLDADSKNSVAQRFAAVRKGLLQGKISAPSAPGIVDDGPPRCGIYVLPDNENAGTLESILLACARLSYPKLLESAERHVTAVNPADYDKSDMAHFLKPAGKPKATIASIGSILKPGKAIQTSIQDNRWLDGQAAKVPEVVKFAAFIQQLLDL